MSKNFVFNSKEIRINGRENNYLVVPEKKGYVVYVKYERPRKWFFDERFNTFANALSYVNACLAYESDGVAWQFKIANVDRVAEQ